MEEPIDRIRIRNASMGPVEADANERLAMAPRLPSHPDAMGDEERHASGRAGEHGWILVGYDANVTRG